MDISFLSVEKTLDVFDYETITQEQLNNKNKQNKYIILQKYTDKNDNQLIIGVSK
jgi:hypothetical protein